MKKPEIRLLNGTEIVVLPNGWEEGGRFISEHEYLRACGKQYLGKRIMSRSEFRAHKKRGLSPEQRAQKALISARSAV